MRYYNTGMWQPQVDDAPAQCGNCKYSRKVRSGKKCKIVCTKKYDNDGNHPKVRKNHYCDRYGSDSELKRFPRNHGEA